eukprot:TRINITY_DN782141_c0_g1_i1.p1 TRINITY_DN782141_c0_g1~~TRINITY_DN782141_c0_g1_i1.p1  ORF type:complete len:433 (-),score=178.73 TRINITY_DN782141_c0_g1_i1:124-1422(-)
MNFELNTERFIDILGKMVGEGKDLQNLPPCVAVEDKAGKYVMEALKPYEKELKIETFAYAEGRTNIIITYEGKTDKTISFVGSHLDTVPANPEEWEKDPFKLTVEGDLLHGRGTTDCLGHVALLTDMFIQLAQTKPELDCTIIAVIIVDEEAGSTENPVGVEKLMEEGELERIKGGPIVWLDCADMQPNIGSGGLIAWELRGFGKCAHSGFPHKGVNALELVNEATKFVQGRFYENFPPHEKQESFGFEMSSSMKPTKVFMPVEGSLNQVPKEVVIQGDVRLIPFYNVFDAKKVIEDAVVEFNEEIMKTIEIGPDSKFTMDEAKVELKLLGEPVQGLACDIDSPGFHALAAGVKQVLGKVEPLADTGTLPLVGDMQKAGYDIQTIGFGVEDAYHAENEFARLSDFVKGFQILQIAINAINESAKTGNPVAKV